VTDKLCGFGFNNELLLLQILNESQQMNIICLPRKKMRGEEETYLESQAHLDDFTA
jgi:hypothetical protein